MLKVQVQVWYVDDSAAGSKLDQLQGWWNMLNEIGPLYGNFPNGAKTKPQHIKKITAHQKSQGYI